MVVSNVKSLPFSIPALTQQFDFEEFGLQNKTTIDVAECTRMIVAE